MTTPHTPPAALDVAAIEARAAAYESAARAYATADHGTAGRAACEAMHDAAHESAADVPALLAALRTLAAQHAADVAAAVAAAVAGERERAVAIVAGRLDADCGCSRCDDLRAILDGIAATGGCE